MSPSPPGLRCDRAGGRSRRSRSIWGVEDPLYFSRFFKKQFGAPLGSGPDAQILAVTAELTDVTDGLPDVWWTAVQAAEVNKEWGIVPCVHVVEAAYAMASTNETSMVVDASYEDQRGAVFMEQFVVPLSSTRVMDPGGAVVGVEPTALALAGEVNPLTLEMQVSLV